MLMAPACLRCQVKTNMLGGEATLTLPAQASRPPPGTSPSWMHPQLPRCCKIGSLVHTHIHRQLHRLLWLQALLLRSSRRQLPRAGWLQRLRLLKHAAAGGSRRLAGVRSLQITHRMCYSAVCTNVKSIKTLTVLGATPQGILIEASPSHFKGMAAARPAATCVHAAVCNATSIVHYADAGDNHSTPQMYCAALHSVSSSASDQRSVIHRPI